MFSFGLVCIYAMTKRVIFAVDDEEVPEGIEILDIVLERQLSYFSDIESIHGLIQYLGNSPWAELIAMIAAEFNADNPRRPFALWQNLDPTFKELIVRMMDVIPCDGSQRMRHWHIHGLRMFLDRVDQRDAGMSLNLRKS
ncbi:hypothetical protein NX059_008326 [Plenodomus lindquistii]|nr:hypothetical protein NX059_008326 [Plenodomus lindquistii]